MSVLKKYNKAFSVIEVLIAVSIITIAFINFLGIVSFSLKSAAFVKKITQANFLAQETMEAVRSFRDGTDWSDDGLGALNTDTGYYPVLTGGSPFSWDMNLGQETIDNFTREVVFKKVSRDPTTGQIEMIYNASNNDPKTRKAIVTIYFGTRSIELTSYFTNWQE